MATGKDLPQIEAQILAPDVEQLQTCDELEKEEEVYLSINYVSYNSDELHNRYTSLRAKLGKLTGRLSTKVRSKFTSHGYCLWSSKAVVLILLWNLIISIGFKSFIDPSAYAYIIIFDDIDYDYFVVMLIYGLPYGLNALLLLFYPLAGFLADVPRSPSQL
jgi:cytochrome c oxidase subunit IV